MLKIMKRKGKVTPSGLTGLKSVCTPPLIWLSKIIIFYDTLLTLRILASYEAKIAKICNFWTFWPVVQLIEHLFKIRQKAFLPNAS